MDALYNNPFVLLAAAAVCLLIVYVIVSKIQRSVNSWRAQRVIDESKRQTRTTPVAHETVLVAPEEEGGTRFDKASSIALKVMVTMVGVLFLAITVRIVLPTRYLPESWGGDTAAKKETLRKEQERKEANARAEQERKSEEVVRKAKANLVTLPEAPTAPVVAPPATPVEANPATFTPPSPATAVPTATVKSAEGCRVYASLGAVVYFYEPSPMARNLKKRSIRVTETQGGPSGYEFMSGETMAVVYPATKCMIDRGTGKVPCQTYGPPGKKSAVAACVE